MADNRRRTPLHPPTTAAVELKTALTGAAVAASAAAYLNGHALGEAVKRQDDDPGARQAHTLREHLRWLRWATPAATGGLLVLDAYLGEQQRGAAGLLDRPLASLRGRR